MKTKFKFLSVLSIIAITFLSSCNSSLTITKRHYNKGYYISTGKIKASELSTNEQQPNKIKVSNENESSTELAYQESADLNSEIKTNETFAIPTNSSDNLDKENVENSLVSNSSSNKSFNEEQTVSHKSRTPLKNIKLIKKLSFKSMKKSVPEPIVGEALSLLWIVILVLVILWLLGFLTGGFGLGGLIHLLLLIALILLILWLLRII